MHDPDERDPEILDLRERHAALDRAVLDAYGWQDIPCAYDYLPEHVEQGTPDGGASGAREIRLRFTDDWRDEILARLLEENRRRAAAGGVAEADEEDGEKDEEEGEEGG